MLVHIQCNKCTFTLTIWASFTQKNVLERVCNTAELRWTCCKYSLQLGGKHCSTDSHWSKTVNTRVVPQQIHERREQPSGAFLASGSDVDSVGNVHEPPSAGRHLRNDVPSIVHSPAGIDFLAEVRNKLAAPDTRWAKRIHHHVDPRIEFLYVRSCYRCQGTAQWMSCDEQLLWTHSALLQNRLINRVYFHQQGLSQRQIQRLEPVVDFNTRCISVDLIRRRPTANVV